MSFLDFFKKKAQFEVSFHIENWNPNVKVPSEYDKLFSLKTFLEKEGINEKDRIMLDKYPFLAAKRIIVFPKPDAFSLESEADQRNRRLVQLGTIERGSALELIDIFAEFMIARFCCATSWSIREGGFLTSDFQVSFLETMAGSDDRKIQILFSDKMIACFADMIIRSGKTILDVIEQIEVVIRYKAKTGTVLGSFINHVGIEKTLALVKRSVQAFFQGGRPYSLNTLLINNLAEKAIEKQAESSQSIKDVKTDVFSFELAGQRYGSSEKGTFFSIVGNDKTKVLSFFPTINSILGAAHAKASGFPDITVSETTFQWEKTSSSYPSVIYKCAVTATGRKPKYPYLVELRGEWPTFQIRLSIQPDGIIGRIQVYYWADEYSYDMIASLSKDAEISFSKIARTSTKDWKETRWV